MMSLLLLLVLTITRPDPTVTPGVARPLTTAEVCTTRWGRDRRHVTIAMKKSVAAAYGVRWVERSNYEFDHLIPRELGGADDVRNLWPQTWANARVKDRRENALHRAVCAGTMSLTAAQDEMRRWGRAEGRRR
jgi:hypothetical protein